MADLTRELRPLLDQPLAEPDPVEQLAVRVRARRRRRRVSSALAVVLAAAVVISVGTVWSRHDDPNRFATTGPTSVGPTQPVVVASGEIEGHAWRLQAYENDSRQCLDLLEGGGACFDALTQHAVDVAVDFTVSDDATGTARTSVASVYGPVRRDVALIAIHLTSGEVVETAPVGQDAGFAVNFYVARVPADIPPVSEPSELIVYDSAGNELDSLAPDCAPDVGGGPAPLTVEIRAVGPCPSRAPPMPGG
jgi:hypothetical protein